MVSETFDPNDIETLKRRIAELEAAKQANLNGSGAVAQGGGDALGERAVKLDQNARAWSRIRGTIGGPVTGRMPKERRAAV